MITIWFTGTELNFAFALAVATGRIASILNSYTAPWLYSDYSLEFFCLMSAYLCVISLLNGVGCYFLDIYAIKSYKKANKENSKDKAIEKKEEKKQIEENEENS